MAGKGLTRPVGEPVEIAGDRQFTICHMKEAVPRRSALSTSGKAPGINCIIGYGCICRRKFRRARIKLSKTYCRNRFGLGNTSVSALIRCRRGAIASPSRCVICIVGFNFLARFPDLNSIPTKKLKISCQSPFSYLSVRSSPSHVMLATTNGHLGV